MERLKNYFQDTDIVRRFPRMALVSSEHLIEIRTQSEPSALGSKLYGVVELEVQVTELLDNLSIALSCLHDLNSLSSSRNCTCLKAFKEQLARITTSLESLKASVQDAFKNVHITEDLLTLSDPKESQQAMSPNDLKQSEGLLPPSGIGAASPHSNMVSQDSYQASSMNERRMRAGCSPTTHRQLVTLEAISEYCSSVRYLRSQNESCLYADDVGAAASGRIIRSCLSGFRISRI
uniref:Uncharacterized protein n=1 Tax=Parascaris univalens TaxID=6257 RepID=A0A915CE15_PARUN